MSHLDEGILHALLDGEIPSAELAPIQAHLAECTACRARLEEERQLLGESAALVEALELPPAGSVPEGRAATRARARSSAWPRNLAWAASLVAALGLGYAARGPLRTPSTEEVVALTPATPAGRDTALHEVAAAPATPQPTPPPSPPAATAADRATQQTRPAGDQPGRRAAPTKAALAKEAITDTAAPGRTLTPANPIPAPAAANVAEAAAPLRQRDEQFRLDERRAGNAGLGLTASKASLSAPAEPILLPDAIRRLGGSLRLIDGLVPLRLEAQGLYVRVVYQVAQGELVLQQQLIDGRVVHSLLAPAGFPADSLSRLRARVRE